MRRPASAGRNALSTNRGAIRLAGGREGAGRQAVVAPTSVAAIFRVSVAHVGLIDHDLNRDLNHLNHLDRPVFAVMIRRARPVSYIPGRSHPAQHLAREPCHRTYGTRRKHDLQQE